MRVFTRQEKEQNKISAEGNTCDSSWWLHNKPPTTIHPGVNSCAAIRDRFSCLQDSIYSNIDCREEEEKSFDSSLCQQNLSKVDVFTSPLLYSVDLQNS